MSDRIFIDTGFVIALVNQRDRYHPQAKEWSLVDCISLVVMRERGIKQVLAFDYHFVQMGFEVLS